MHSSARPAVVALHAAVLLFGFAGLFGRWLALDPAVIVLGRTLVAATALVAFTLARRTLAPPNAGLATNGLILAVHWTAFFAAVQWSSVATGLLGYATFPLFVLLLEHAGERGPWRREEIVVVVLVTIGIVNLVPPFEAGERAFAGLGAGVVSGFTFAWLAVRSKRHAATHAPDVVALWQNAFAALALAAFVALRGEAIAPIDARTVALMIVLGVACTAGAHTLFIASMRRVSAHTASVVAALEPVYGIALAALLIAERPTLREIVGAVLIVGAALYATRRAR